MGRGGRDEKEYRKKRKKRKYQTIKLYHCDEKGKRNTEGGNMNET